MAKSKKLELKVLTGLEADEIRTLLIRDILTPNKDSTQKKVDKVLVAVDALCLDVARSSDESCRDARKEVAELETAVENLRRDKVELQNLVKALEADGEKLAGECAGLRQAENVFVSREQLGKALDEAEEYNKRLRAEIVRLQTEAKEPSGGATGAPNLLQTVRLILGLDGNEEMSVVAAARATVERLRESTRRADLLQKERDLYVKERDEARSALSTGRKQWSDEAYVQHEELRKLSQALGQKKLLGHAQESLLDAAIRLSEGAVEAENEAVRTIKGALGQSRFKDCTIDDVAGQVGAIVQEHERLRAEHALALKKIEGLQMSCDTWSKYAENDRKLLAEALGYDADPAKSKRMKDLIFDVSQLRSNFYEEREASEKRARSIEDFEIAIGNIADHLQMSRMQGAKPVERGEYIVQMLQMNYVHKDAVTGGRDRIFSCRVCAKTSRWSREHETLGYVQRLCSDCFKEHGVVPTSSTIEDGSYAKAIDAGKTDVQKDLRDLRREHLRVLGEVQTALGEHYKNASLGCSTAAMVKKVCDSLDEACDRIKKFDDAFALIGKMLKLGVMPEEPEGKARACVAITEALLGGFKIANERAEKQAEVINKLREFVKEWDKVSP